MIRGVDIYATRDFPSKYDDDKDNPTIFEIGHLDSQMEGYILDKVSDFELSSDNPDDDTKLNWRINERNLALVKFGLKNIKNFNDPQTGKPINFKCDVVNKFGKNYNVVPDEILNMIPLKVKTELAAEILKETNLSKDAEKN